MHVDRADAQAHMLLAIQEIEIDQLAERPAQRRGVVDAERFGSGIGHEHGGRYSWREESRHAERRCGEGVEPVQPRAQRRELRKRVPWQSGRDPIPEFAQPLEPSLDRIARNQRTVDGADRHARHPIRRESLLRHPLVNARLVRAQRTAALQHQHRVIVRHVSFRESGRVSAGRVFAFECVEQTPTRARWHDRPDILGGTRRIAGAFDPPAAERTVQIDQSW